MSTALSIAALVAAFGLFMGLIALVHALNRYAAERYGYEPFAMPNAALMSIAVLLLLSAASALSVDEGPRAALASLTAPGLVKVGLWGLLSIGMFGLLAWRTGVWVAVAATAVLATVAPVVLMTQLFKRLAR